MTTNHKCPTNAKLVKGGNSSVLELYFGTEDEALEAAKTDAVKKGEKEAEEFESEHKCEDPCGSPWFRVDGFRGSEIIKSIANDKHVVAGWYEWSLFVKCEPLPEQF